MPADLGTKVLASQRFEELKKLMNMEVGMPLSRDDDLVNGKMVKLAILLSLIKRAQGLPAEADENDSGADGTWGTLSVLIGMYTVFVIFMTLGLVWVCRRYTSSSSSASTPSSSMACGRAGMSLGNDSSGMSLDGMNSLKKRGRTRQTARQESCAVVGLVRWACRLTCALRMVKGRSSMLLAGNAITWLRLAKGW